MRAWKVLTLDVGSRKQKYVKESDKDYYNNAAENIWENNWWYSPCTIPYREENYHEIRRSENH